MARPYIDITNKRFGNLIALEPIIGTHPLKWKCKCDCGNECEKRGTDLRSGRHINCGDRRKHSTAWVPNPGDRFGKWTVIKDSGKRKYGSHLITCICDCGTIQDVYAPSLKNHYSTSCGCKRSQSLSEFNKKRAEEENLIGKKFNKLTVIERLGAIKDNDTHVYYKCKCECGGEIITRGVCLTNGETQSCGCLKSKGEEKIIQILNKNNISFIQQKSFATCRFLDTNALAKFDFYINSKYLVEYDGEQHFIDKGEIWDSLKKVQDRDNFKNQWCKENNIPLIRIPYTRYNDLCIEDLLLETSQFIVGE